MKSIIQSECECFVCGTTQWLEEHHILGGPNRKWSEKYGLKVYLCKRHHMEAHQNELLALKLKQTAQRAFERKYKKTSFLAVFGRLYI